MAILEIDIPREIERIETNVLHAIPEEDAETIRALIIDAGSALSSGSREEQHTIYEKLRAIDASHTITESFAQADEWRTTRRTLAGLD